MNFYCNIRDDKDQHSTHSGTGSPIRPLHSAG